MNVKGEKTRKNVCVCVSTSFRPNLILRHFPYVFTIILLFLPLFNVLQIADVSVLYDWFLKIGIIVIFI